VQFIAYEFFTGKRHGGIIDTLGIDLLFQSLYVFKAGFKHKA